MSEANPYTQPVTEDQALKLVLVDQSRDAQDEARDRADERLDKELGEGNGFKKFVNGIWKGNIAKDYYRQKYVNQALESIQSNDDILTGSPADRRTRALESTIERFQSDYDEVIHTEAGESREKVADDSQLAGEVKHLIREFVEGRLNASTLREERTRLLNDHYARTEQNDEAAASRKKGIATTDNLLEIAQAVAGVVEHGESLDNALGRLEVITGEARNGARTEANYNSVDKAVDWLSKKGIASFVTPGALAVGAALAMSVTRNTAQSVTVAVGKTLIPGAVAGIWAGVRENKRTKDERAQHAREMAVGGQFEETDKRRVDMERARYDTIPAATLVESLRSKTSVEQYAENGSEAVQAALDALACIQARVQLSDSKKLDLISYSSKENVGEERMMLDLARRDVRLALEASLTPDVRTELSIAHDKDIRELLQEKSDFFSEVLTGEEISDKDKAFAKLKARRVAKATAIGVATGIVGGVIAQEVVAGFDPERYGLIDMVRGEAPIAASDGEVHQTIAAGFIRGEEYTVHTGPSSTYENYNVATNGTILLSDDSKFEYGPNGTMSIVDANGETSVEGLAIDANGTLDQASLDKLDAAGMVVEDKSFNTTEVTQTTQEVSGNQYIQNHIAETTAVTRDLWYGNNTPGIFDQNELRVYRGGSADAPGIIDGGYQYTVAGMTAEGSWQGGESVNWNEAATNGNLFVAVSGTYDTQGNPFMIPIGPDGAVNIPADSPAGQFFANENNSVDFNGAYMEIVQTTGQDENGIVHMRPLATLVGDGAFETGSGEGRTITETITTETTIHHAEYTITTDGHDTTIQNSTESAPITPIASRRSMESLKSAEVEGIAEGGTEYGDYYGGYMSEMEREQARKEFSPRFENNPNAELNPGDELDWYRGEVIRRKGEAYVKDIENFAERDPAMRKLSNNTESLVVIPVGAAFESENIYGTLSLYAQQEGAGTDKSALLLNVNWLDTAMNDPEKVAAMQKTLSEIERAKQDFPDLTISVIQKEYNEAEVTETGGVIGYVMEDLVNTAMIATQRRMAVGSIDRDHDLVVIRTDADSRGLSRTMLKNYQREITNDKNIDVVQGAIRYGVRDSVKFPGYGVVSSVMTMFQGIEIQNNKIFTNGVNFGVRASTLAAIGGLGEMLVNKGNGRLERHTGAGSDDLIIGRRIELARDTQSGSQYQYNSAFSYVSGSGQTGAHTAIKRVKLVTGATTDTSAERLVPMYLTGQPIEQAWNPQTGYGSGPGGYRSREADAAIVANAEKDTAANENVYSMIEKTLSKRLEWSSETIGRRVLALLFARSPGAYVITGDLSGNGPVEFKLTDVGRKFIKSRMQRETNGPYGPFGMRKMRQLYGVTKPGAKRQPASSTPPLVSPLS